MKLDRQPFELMVFGVLIDVPIIVGGYLLMLVYRRQLAARIAGVAIHPLVTCILLSVPLIILEEQINCMTAWCGRVLIPPTLPFLLFEIIVLSLISLRIHARSAFLVASAYSVFGVLWEVFLGGLVGAGPIIIAIFGPYVWISYGFVSILPLSVLIERKSSAPKSQEAPVLSAATSPPAISTGYTK